MGSPKHFLLGLLLLVIACDKPTEGTDSFATREQLMDPTSCMQCHPQAYNEWAGSMHAYASKDPIFLAMNARGQRESGGELGEFCVQCHAPLALRTGATTDGLNLPELPEHLQGVNCYFCHTVAAVEGTHNNPLVLTMEQEETAPETDIMLGGIQFPNDNSFHKSGYSKLLDRNQLESGDLCGTCHDIVTPDGVHVERTYHEWQNSVFGKAEAGQPLSCSQCHMPGANGRSSTGPGGQERRLHNHSMPGVDIALNEFPDRENQRAAVQNLLDNTLLPRICVQATDIGSSVSITLENIAAGHSWPSGAAPDRRAWVEFSFYAGNELVLAAGSFPEDEALTTQSDPYLWRLGDKALDAEGEEVHLFWQAVSYETALLKAPKDNSPFNHGSRLTHVQREYDVEQVVDRVTMRVKLRPIGLDILDSLIESGDLDSGIRSQVPTFTLRSTDIEWTPEQGECVPW